jgi:hypothetical protein
MESNMHVNTVSELEQKTRVYWEISRCYQGRSNKTISVERAIKTVGQMLRTLNPHRPLFHALSALQHEIIYDHNPDLEVTSFPSA